MMIAIFFWWIGLSNVVAVAADTRGVLIRSLEMLRTKREELPKRKHGNIPL